jgi:hypothetical protein
MIPSISWQLKVKIANESNSSENRHVKAHRHRIQKGKVKAKFVKEKPNIRLPCKVTLTRIAPRSLDAHDNLPMSMKWIVDAIADCIIPGLKPGRADDNKEISWEYKQEKGKPHEYGLKIEIS